VPALRSIAAILAQILAWSQPPGSRHPFPLASFHSGLPQYSSKQVHSDVAPMRIWQDQSTLAANHELVTPT